MSNVVLPYQPQFSSWQPPTEILDHNGQPISASAEFFQMPPAEIGALITAHSSLASGKQHVPLFLRLSLLIGVPALLVIATWYLAQSFRRGGDAEMLTYILGGVAVIVGFLVTLSLTQFNHSCSYVGTVGLVRYLLKGSRTANLLQETFLFSDAVELRTGQTRKFVNGAYTGTTYRFTWTDAAGRVVRKFKGTYKSKVGTPKQRDAYWLPYSAERAWSNFLLERIEEELKTNGYIQFNLGGANFVRVGRGFFEFGMKGELARINVDEIKTLNLNQGQFHIHHKDAGWLSRKGKFSFPYATMANARLFLLAMQKLTGYHFV